MTAILQTEKLQNETAALDTEVSSLNKEIGILETKIRKTITTDDEAAKKLLREKSKLEEKREFCICKTEALQAQIDSLHLDVLREKRADAEKVRIEKQVIVEKALSDYKRLESELKDAEKKYDILRLQLNNQNNIIGKLDFDIQQLEKRQNQNIVEPQAVPA
jgi:chromosome segregation ATPase